MKAPFLDKWSRHLNMELYALYSQNHVDWCSLRLYILPPVSWGRPTSTSRNASVMMKPPWSYDSIFFLKVITPLLLWKIDGPCLEEKMDSYKYGEYVHQCFTVARHCLLRQALVERSRATSNVRLNDCAYRKDQWCSIDHSASSILQTFSLQNYQSIPPVITTSIFGASFMT